MAMAIEPVPTALSTVSTLHKPLSTRNAYYEYAAHAEIGQGPCSAAARMQLYGRIVPENVSHISVQEILPSISRD